MNAASPPAAALFCLALLGAECIWTPQQAPPTEPLQLAAGVLADTRGPNGELPTASSTVTLTDAETATIMSGHYTAAFSWHTSSEFTAAVQAGAQDEFTRLGIDTVATTDADFNAAKQKSDIETLLAKRPSALISLPLDPTISAESFRPALQAGTKLVFLSNVPMGYRQGTDFVSTVTDDLFQMGKQSADVLARSIGSRGKVGWMFHDTLNYVTNQRDSAFKTTIERDYPDIRIVAQRGIADPANAEDAANAMLTQNPEQLMLHLRDRGRAIVLVSHNLDQVFRVSDRIAVLRRGVQIGIRDTRRTSANEIVSMITGLQAADATSDC